MNANEMMGNEFLSLEFDAQEQLIINCLVHSATFIDSKVKKADADSIADGYEKEFINGLKVSAMTYVNNEDVRQSAWMLTLEKANHEKASETPLLYMVCKATNKALSDAIYGNIKGNKDDSIDTETPLCSYFDSVESQVIDGISRMELYEYLPIKIRNNCIAMLDMMEYGYTKKEICGYFEITEKTLAQWESACVSATARQKAENHEYRIAQMLIESKRAKQNVSAYKTAQKAIYAILNGLESYKEESPKTKAEKKWLAMDYMERIRFITYHKEEFKLLVNSK